jgi:hypothetical protein
MKPIVMRSLGARAPPRPRVAAETMDGATALAPMTAAAPRKKRRRVIFTGSFINFPLDEFSITEHSKWFAVE